MPLWTRLINASLRQKRLLLGSVVLTASAIANLWACSVNDIPAQAVDAGQVDGNTNPDVYVGGDSSATDSSTVDAGDSGVVDAGTGFAQISEVGEATNGGVCALMRDGRVACWGTTYGGTLGVPDDGGGIAYSPQYVLGISNAVQISVSDFTACAALADGTLRCWGAMNGSTWLPSHVVVGADGGVLNNVASVSAGGINGTGLAVARLKTGGAVCFGNNSNGTCSNGGTSSSNLATDMLFGVNTPMTNVVALATMEGGNGCAVLSDGTVRCDGYGNRGDGITQNGVVGFVVPVGFSSQAPLTGVGSVACGTSHCCMVQKDGSAVNCVGANVQGEHGTLNTTAWVDTAVTGLSGKVLSIAAGNQTTCAVIDNGTIQCWGADGWGQLGDGVINNTPQSTPVTVKGLPNVKPVSVMTNGLFSCAVLDDGSAYCWGQGTYGVLGDGQGKASLTPVKVLMPK